MKPEKLMLHLPPGRLQKEDSTDVLLMIGTAGHVDHGKTRLVRLLTGCETDRLKAEKERGLSIELGFAPCRLGKGLSAGIVDVPGHEQFIKNMVAGAAGMDMALLIIAADDGVMPQTIEHLQIMQFMGVQLGMVVISKTDLVTPERVNEVRESLAALIQGTFLENAPICPVSAETLEGFDGFYQTLVSTALEAKIKRREGIFRMPIERVFSPPGFGTVATGIPLAGSIQVGEEVEIQPGGFRVRVRGIQRFLKDAMGGHSGQCLALNLAGLPKNAVRRGSVIAAPGYVKLSSFLQGVLTTTPDRASPLRSGELVKLHTGTLEVQAKLTLYDPSPLQPNQTGFGALRLFESIPASPTDRFVLRLNSPPITVCGGVLLQVWDRKPKGSRASWAMQLAEQWNSFHAIQSRLEHYFLSAGPQGSTIASAAVALLILPSEAQAIVEDWVQKEILIPVSSDLYLHQKNWVQAEMQLLSYLKLYHFEQESDFGPTLNETASTMKWPDALLQALSEEMVKKGKLERKESRISLPGRQSRFDTRTGDLLQRMEDIYREGQYATPRPDELSDLLQSNPKEVEKALDYLCQQGTLVRLGKNVVFHQEWMKEAEKRVVDVILKQGELDSADFKTLIHSSRKYAIALLDYFDRIHITQRSDNLRRLHPSYLRKHPELLKK